MSIYVTASELSELSKTLGVATEMYDEVLIRIMEVQATECVRVLSNRYPEHDSEAPDVKDDIGGILCGFRGAGDRPNEFDNIDVSGDLE